MKKQQTYGRKPTQQHKQVSRRLAVCLGIVLTTYGATSLASEFSDRFSPKSLASVVNTFALQEHMGKRCFSYEGDIHRQSVASGEMQTQVYTSARSYAESAGVGAKVALGYGLFSANSNFSLSTSKAGSETGVVVASLLRKSQSLSIRPSEFELTELGKKRVAQINKAFPEIVSGPTFNDQQTQAIKNFYQQCGLAIIQSVEVGNIASLNIEITTSSREAKDQIKAGVGVGATGFADLSTNMQNASQQKRTNFTISTYAQAAPNRVMKTRPGQMSQCRWNGETHQWGKACLTAMKQFDQTSEAFTQQPADTARVIRFPTTMATHEIGNFLSEGAANALDRVFSDMKQDYEHYSRHYFKVKQQADTLSAFIHANAFPKGSIIDKELQSIGYDSWLKFTEKTGQLGDALKTVTYSGFLSSYMKDEIESIIKEIKLSQLLRSLSKRLQNNPSNTVNPTKIDVQLTAHSSMPNQRLAVTFPQSMDTSKILEVVVDGNLVAKQGDNFSQPVQLSLPENFCRYDRLPAQVYGYIVVNQNPGKPTVYPMVIHSLRTGEQAQRCDIVLDQNIHPLSVEVFERTKVQPSIAQPFSQELPVQKYYWSSISGLEIPITQPQQKQYINVQLNIHHGNK